MPVWRRRQFAAPFVLVIGCGQPTKPAEPTVTSTPNVRAEHMTQSGTDAAIVVMTSIDAAPGKCELDPTASGCNPPAPARPALDAPVLRVHGAQNGGFEFDIGAGTDEGFDATRGEFLDEAGNPIPKTKFVIKQRTKRTSLGHLPSTFSELPSQRVRVYGERS